MVKAYSNGIPPFRTSKTASCHTHRGLLEGGVQGTQGKAVRATPITGDCGWVKKARLSCSNGGDERISNTSAPKGLRKERKVGCKRGSHSGTLRKETKKMPTNRKEETDLAGHSLLASQEKHRLASPKGKEGGGLQKKKTGESSVSRLRAASELNQRRIKGLGGINGQKGG